MDALDLTTGERVSFLAATGIVPETLVTNAAVRTARLEALRSTHEVDRGPLRATLEAARQQEEAFLDATYAALVSALSPAAATRLNAYVETRVRSRVRMYSVPQMSHGDANGGH